MSGPFNRASSISQGGGPAAGGGFGMKELAAAGIGLQLGSGLGAAFNAIRDAKFNEKIAEMNAEIARIQGRFAIRRGRFESGQRLRAGQRDIGTARAVLAARGQDLESGTALQIQEDIAGLAAQDARRIRNNAALAAWGYEVEAEGFKLQGGIAMQQGIQQAVGGALTTGAQAGLDIYKYQGAFA